MSKVPKLTLSDGSYQPMTSEGVETTTKIHVFCGGISDLQTDNDLEKMANILEAKKNFNSRTDIVCFITADDLIRVQKTDSGSKVYLRLVIETPHRKTSSSSPKISPSTKNKDCALTARKENRRSQSVGNDKQNGVNINTSFKMVALEGEFFNVSYIVDDNKFSMFILKKIDDHKLFCVGAKDNNVRSEGFKGYCTSTIVNINANVRVMLLAEKIIPQLSFPAYFSIMSDIEYTVDKFVEMCQVLLEQLVEQYRIENKK